MQVRLEKEDMAKKQRDSLENIEEAALAWRRKVLTFSPWMHLTYILHFTGQATLRSRIWEFPPKSEGLHKIPLLCTVPKDVNIHPTHCREIWSQWGVIGTCVPCMMDSIHCGAY